MSARQVLWTRPRYEEFVYLAMLTEFEKNVLDLHMAADGKERRTDYQIADELNTSESAVKDTIRLLKEKYDAVQPYSFTLPPRKKHKNEQKYK